MILLVSGHKFHYECENICRVFFPNEKISVVHDKSKADYSSLVAETCLSAEGDEYIINVRLIDGDEIKEKKQSVCGGDDKCELEMAKMLFALLSEKTDYIPPWGVLTGVRPSKLMIKLSREIGEEKALSYFTDELLVKPQKAELALTVSKNEEKIINSCSVEDFSLYVAIPFCPTRCSYCSFVSHSISNSNAKKLVPDYVKYLGEELKHTAEEANRLKLNLKSIYFGGGTPGILTPEQIDYLTDIINSNFDVSNLCEYTFEIGRPDTVTKEKLMAVKNHGVGRISINPQTFNQQTLDAIGRRHSVEEIFSAFEKAREVGFDCINMDLIAGLPGETCSDFAFSLDSALSLEPENITVHSLALKRSSNLNYNGCEIADGAQCVGMLDYTGEKLTEKGYIPYYMYRQSKCVGNLENVGWCKGDTKGFYNVIMMEECHTVLGCGAGAVTKLCDPATGKVERIFNYKYPFEYISGFDTLKERKGGISKFYSERQAN